MCRVRSVTRLPAPDPTNSFDTFSDWIRGKSRLVREPGVSARGVAVRGLAQTRFGKFSPWGPRRACSARTEAAKARDRNNAAPATDPSRGDRSEEHTSELQSP